MCGRGTAHQARWGNTAAGGAGISREQPRNLPNPRPPGQGAQGKAGMTQNSRPCPLGSQGGLGQGRGLVTEGSGDPQLRPLSCSTPQASCPCSPTRPRTPPPPLSREGSRAKPLCPARTAARVFQVALHGSFQPDRRAVGRVAGCRRSARHTEVPEGVQTRGLPSQDQPPESCHRPPPPASNQQQLGVPAAGLRGAGSADRGDKRVGERSLSALCAGPSALPTCGGRVRVAELSTEGSGTGWSDLGTRGSGHGQANRSHGPKETQVVTRHVGGWPLQVVTGDKKLPVCLQALLLPR